MQERMASQMALISRAGEGRRPKSMHDTPHLLVLKYQDSGIRGQSTKYFCRDEPVSPIPGGPKGASHRIAPRTLGISNLSLPKGREW
jgi:hypothetical protein